MMTLEERNKLAETIVETGGVWLLPYGKQLIKVTPCWTDKLCGGRTAVRVMAVKGKPFVQKYDSGEGFACKFKSMFKSVWPEQLETATSDKEGVGKKE